MELLVDKDGIRRVGSYIHSSNGQKCWPFDPLPGDIDIEVVAHHLACQSRWAGATQHPKFAERISYSVAEHSVYVADETCKTHPEFELEALLHDGPEYVIMDLIRPIKYSPEFNAPYKKIETLGEIAFANKFNLVYPLPAAVKRADEAVCEAENRQIVPKHKSEEWVSGLCHDNTHMASVEIAMMEPYVAKRFFLARFAEAIANREKYRPLPKDFKL
ncbi:MAG: hypothetical protein ACEQSB_00615 [Undibacterium sp.]